MGAIESISRVLNVKGNILPSTLDVVTLYAMMKDGTLVRGEKNIPTVYNSIDHVFYQTDVQAYKPAIDAIENADLIIYLEDGQIKESGTHDELLKKKGRYYDIYNDQFRDFNLLEEEVI